jgi:hypothetical protein
MSEWHRAVPNPKHPMGGCNPHGRYCRHNVEDDPVIVLDMRPRIVAELWALRHRLSYWLRPYDMLADARRWRWQRPEPCGRQAWAQLAETRKQAILAALDRLRERDR